MPNKRKWIQRYRIEDCCCSTLWIGNPTLIDFDVHLHCILVSFYEIVNLDAGAILTFSGHLGLLWFLNTTFIISKYMLFYFSEDGIGTVAEFCLGLN